MSYAVKEIFYTLQGEGTHAGRAAVLCRFAGCNLWSGREADRGRAACRFCDTDFVGTDGPGGGRFDNEPSLARAVREAWPADTQGAPLVVCTGGEPLLQLDVAAIAAFHAEGFEVAVETNGTQPAPGILTGADPAHDPAHRIDHLVVSPKAGTELTLTTGHELKLIFPQPGAEPERFEPLKFDRHYLQPMDGPHRDDNVRAAMLYCLAHPKWRLSLQIHKLLGIP